MKYKYFVPDNGDTIEDAQDVYFTRLDNECNWQKIYDRFGGHEDAAEYAAKLYYEAVAPDWNEGEQSISIVDELGIVETFDASIEYNPSFSVTRKR